MKIFFINLFFIFSFVSCQTWEPYLSKEKFDSEEIKSFVKLSPQIFSGGEPKDEKDFRFLKSKGIKTILSVDGALPKIELSDKYQLEYLHVPVGYDRWSMEDVLKVVKAFHQGKFPMYVHCHHGKHRGPTASALGRMVVDRASRWQAIEEMKMIGTSPRYQGLFKTVEFFRLPAKKAVESLSKIPSKAPVSDFKAAMARMDRHWDEVKKARERAWADDIEHPDISVPHEALQLAELLTEVARDKKITEKPQQFQEILIESKNAAWDFERMVRKLRKSSEQRKHIDQSFEILKDTCYRCHREFRE